MSSRAEQLQLLLQKKRDAEQKALQIVVALLESGISRESLLEAAKYINVEYYSDVTTERAISLTCGYPLCNKRLTNVPKQKYRISLSQKKVFDLTELKNFCCDQCFRASKYFEAQLSASPVWLLEEERSKQSRIARPSLIDDEPISPSVGTVATRGSSSSHRGCSIGDRGPDSVAVVVSVGDIAARVDDLSLLDVSAAIGSSDSQQRRSSVTNSSDICQAELIDPAAAASELRSSRSAASCDTSPATSEHSVFASGRGHDSPTVQKRPPLPRSMTTAAPRPSVTSAPPSEVALNRLSEWYTEATRAWLLDSDGSNPGKTLATGAAAVETPSVEASSSCDGRGTSSPTHRVGLIAGPEASAEPAPLAGDHYTQRALQFLLAGEHKAASVGGKKAAASSNDASVDDGRVVPPSEAHAQEAIRRRIVAERLTKSLGQAEAILGTSVIDEIRSRNLSRLVASFKLNKDNATMKPAEWLLTVLTLAYLITVGDEVTNQKIGVALTSYGYTASDLRLIRQRFELL